MFCVSRSRGGNRTSVGILFVLIFVAVAVLLHVGVTCCYLSYVTVIRPCCLFEHGLCVSVQWRSILQASVCSEFLNQRKTRESKKRINSQHGALLVEVIFMHPMKILNSTGYREKCFQTVNMLSFWLSRL